MALGNCKKEFSVNFQILPVMKQFFFSGLLAFTLFSCGNGKPDVNTDSLRADSALKAQNPVSQRDSLMPVTHSTDTTHMVALPPVMEGDLVFQEMDDAQSQAFGKTSRSKYNNIGLIFLRPKDRQYIVFEVKDSCRITLLSDWVERGKKQHVALLRLKNANQLINEKKAKALKTTAKQLVNTPFDPYYSWSDDALYPSEMAWKLYHKAVKIDLCTPGKLSSFDLSDPLTKQQLKNKYGNAVPQDEQVVSPDDLYHSPKLEVIFER